MVKAAIKKLILKCLKILLKDKDIRLYLKRELSTVNKNVDKLRHLPIPYEIKCNNGDLALETSRDRGKTAVIITGRFRSGTTLFWNMFRNATGYHSFYEPFNERQWFNSKTRGENVDSSHRGVSDYWYEYNNFEILKNFYCEDWIRTNLLMTEESWEPEMFKFVDCLIKNTTDRPVLQFNRIDFRLPWFRHFFPYANYIHIYRNPRDQFCSFLTNKKAMNSTDVHKTYVDGFYLYSWCDDLSLHFPFLSLKQNLHPYKYFYFVWKLSYIYGSTYADMSVSYEDLVMHPKKCLQNIFTLLGDNKADIKQIASLVDKPAIEGWKSYACEDWFIEHEHYCELVLKTYFKN